jgi:hypothetical protein
MFEYIYVKTNRAMALDNENILKILDSLTKITNYGHVRIRILVKIFSIFIF